MFILFIGRRSLRQCDGCPPTIIAKLSRSHAKGSISFSLAVSTKDATIAHFAAPPSLPANKLFLRPIALSRKNSLFAGSEGGARRWAIVASLIETAKLNGVELYAWLCDSLTRMVDGHPANRLDELMPWMSA